jgi:DnaK suppressor protein
MQKNYDGHLVTDVNHQLPIKNGAGVDDDRARLLLSAERSRVENLLDAVKGDGESDRTAANQHGDMSDSSELLVSEGTDDAVADALTRRLAAIERAEQRLAAGTYGRSISSGESISDERLEADPAAELTFDEAQNL